MQTRREHLRFVFIVAQHFTEAHDDTALAFLYHEQ